MADRRPPPSVSSRASSGASTPSTTGFAAVGVPSALVDPLATVGIGESFPIQTATLTDALAGRDVLGRRRTGSSAAHDR
jgi:superfamily II DNA/RNA helicase